MNRRNFLRGIAVAVASLPFVGQLAKPRATVQAATHEFTDEEPFGFQPPSVTCWRPGQGQPPWSKPKK